MDPIIGRKFSVPIDPDGYWIGAFNAIKILGWGDDEVILFDTVKDGWFLNLLASKMNPLKYLDDMPEFDGECIEFSGITCVLSGFGGGYEAVLIRVFDWDKFLAEVLHISTDKAVKKKSLEEERIDRMNEVLNCSHEGKLFPGSNICSECGAVMEKEE